MEENFDKNVRKIFLDSKYDPIRRAFHTFEIKIIMYLIFWPSDAKTRPFVIKFLNGGLSNNAVEITNNV